MSVHSPWLLCRLADKNSLQKEKEDLDDISNELELADEDDKIPYAPPSDLLLLVLLTAPKVTRSATPSSHCPYLKCKKGYRHQRARSRRK
jgi:hypothetical protein